MLSGDRRADALSSLIRHLHGRLSTGEKYVWISGDARNALLALKDQNLAKRRPPSPVPSPTPSRGPSAHPNPQSSPSPPLPRTAPGTRSSQQGLTTPIAAKTTSPATATGSSKRDRLDSLIAQAKNCPNCAALGTFRQTMVFSCGNPDADFMFIGEAPGAEEELQAQPFVGPAGQLLTKIIAAAGLDRSHVYISNICKFRPSLPNQTSNNRKPTSEELEACLPYILAEIDIVRPKVIVALGNSALEGLLGSQMSVARARESVHEIRGIPLIVTYHPSYLLRNTSFTERRKLWEDIMKAMEIVGLPISEKQRNFFRGK